MFNKKKFILIHSHYFWDRPRIKDTNQGKT